MSTSRRAHVSYTHSGALFYILLHTFAFTTTTTHPRLSHLFALHLPHNAPYPYPSITLQPFSPIFTHLPPLLIHAHHAHTTNPLCYVSHLRQITPSHAYHSQPLLRATPNIFHPSPFRSPHRSSETPWSDSIAFMHT